jgi:hypothetical protein
MIRFILASVFMAALAVPQTALAASTFYGNVVHVSVDNVKVYNPKTHQTLSFLVTPKFSNIVDPDGKPTYQMKDLKPGQYVEVVYDQKALGVRHADRIVIMRSNNTAARKQIPSHLHVYPQKTPLP